MIEPWPNCQQRRLLRWRSSPPRSTKAPAPILAGYRQAMAEAWETVDPAAFERVAAMLAAAIRVGRIIYACGNGGSASIADHLHCDVLKGAQTDTALRPENRQPRRPHSSSSRRSPTTSTMPRYSSSNSGRWRAGRRFNHDQSSGNSENIVRAIDWSRQRRRHDRDERLRGRRSSKLAEINLHVEAENYGVVEDIHQSMMHAWRSICGRARWPRRRSSPTLSEAN